MSRRPYDAKIPFATFQFPTRGRRASSFSWSWPGNCRIVSWLPWTCTRLSPASKPQRRPAPVRRAATTRE